ncbi:hypothetical protein V8F20_000511 [Naviculisporaceae sp. PSN 640]
MADPDNSEGKHSWKFTPWSGIGSPKPKRLKRWILPKSPSTIDPAAPIQDRTTNSDYRRTLTMSGDTLPSQSSGVETSGLEMSNLVRGGASPVSDDIRLLTTAQTPPPYAAAKEPHPGMDNMTPFTPIAVPENYEEPSGGTITPRGTLTRTQTRFREELGSSDVDSVRVLEQKHSHNPVDCSSIHDPALSRRSEFALAFWCLSIFSTLGSFIWLVTAAYQPRWGRLISSGGNLTPSTASLIVALFAKLIETAFVAVFVASVGQILTKRAFDRKSRGMNLAEISMRNWVIQPGLMITDAPAVRIAAFTLLGVICLVATAVGMLYTTASDALVSPKLRYGSEQEKTLKSYTMASYANLPYIRDRCVIPDGMDKDSSDACLAVSLSGASYHNLQAFLSTWHDNPPKNASSGVDIMTTRPPVTSILFENITVTAAWIEGEHSDPDLQWKAHNRTINNVTLAIPHPGVYLAATDPTNDILQPSDLAGVGEYEMRASTVSPAVNVLCANVNSHELKPLIYTAWPNASSKKTNIPGQLMPKDPKWIEEVPVFGPDEWLNRTVLDDIFRWGPKYGRRPPVFPMLPMRHNVINNATVYMSDAFYILAKSNATTDFTLCEMRSWLSPKCSTQFNISGTTGAHMRAHCEDPLDDANYSRRFPKAPNNNTSGDWRNLADEWNLALYLNSGLTNANASRDRILTQLILTEPRLSSRLPSFAEAFAALAAPTLILGSLYTSLGHDWNQTVTTVPAPGLQQQFTALLRTQEYTSTHNNEWQGVFYIVLLGVFGLNCLCLSHFALSLKGRPLTDYTDPPNLFALAINSPPSEAMKGCCGGRLNGEVLSIPYGIGYSGPANHYYFEEKEGCPEEGAEGEEYKTHWENNSKTTMFDKTNLRNKPGSIASSKRSRAGSSLSDTILPDDPEKDGHDLERDPSNGLGSTYDRLANTRAWL